MTSVNLDTVARSDVHAISGLVEREGKEIAARPAAALRPSHGRAWLMHRLLAGADAVGLTAAFAVTVVAFGALESRQLSYFLATLPLWIVTAKLYGLYDRDEHRTFYSTADDLVGVFHVLTVGLWILLGTAELVGVMHTPLLHALLFWAVAIVAVVTSRAVARTIASRSDLYVQRAIVVGAGEVGQALARKLLAHPEYGVQPVGFVDDDPMERPDDLAELDVLGSLQDVTTIVNRLGVQRVIVAFSNESHEAFLDLLRQMKQLQVEVDVVPRLFEMIGSETHLGSIEGVAVVSLPPPHLSRLSRAAKRGMDLVLATVGVVLLSPFFLAAAVAIRATSPGPAFFRQVRMGERGEVFKIFKFRTMVANAEELKSELSHLNVHLADDDRMFKIPDDPRATRVGRFLRRTDLDELPQLFNVIRGEMSLVGPRPLILEEDAHIKAWGRKRLDLKPGMTGPWQALGASTIPFEEMVRLDYLYITNWSLFQDVKWIWRTIARLIARKYPVHHTQHERA